jgi:hypothetical protein
MPVAHIRTSKQSHCKLLCWIDSNNLTGINVTIVHLFYKRFKNFGTVGSRHLLTCFSMHWSQKNLRTVALRLLVFQLSISVQRRSQWPRGLRHELSSPAQTLGSWVWILLEAWMSVCVYSVFVLSCVQTAALRRAHPPSKEPYPLCKRSRNWKGGQGPTKGCRAIDR